MRVIAVDERRCGCGVIVLLNGSAFTNARLKLCAQHDPGFCTARDYYDRGCVLMKHEGDAHARTDGGWSSGTTPAPTTPPGERPA